MQYGSKHTDNRVLQVRGLNDFPDNIASSFRTKYKHKFRLREQRDRHAKCNDRCSQDA